MDSARRQHLQVLLVSVFIFANLLCYSNTMPLFHEEPRRAIVAQEMLMTGDYVVPTVFQIPYHKKPPMHNWLIALVSKPFGAVNGFSARLVSVLCLLATGLGVYAFLRRRRPEVAFAAFVITVTNYLMMCEYGNKVEPDIVITAFTVGSFLVYMLNPTGWITVMASGLLMGAGILTKGMSPLYFYPAVLVHLLITPGRRGRPLAFLLLHVVVSLALPLAWLLTYRANADISQLANVLSEETTGRLWRGVADLLMHAVAFPAKTLLVMLPWPLLVWFAFRTGKTTDPVRRTSLLVFFISLIIFSLIPTARSRYLMPAYPFLAMAAAFYIDPSRIPPPRIQQVVFGLLGLASLSVSVLFLTRQHLLPGAVLLVNGLVCLWLLRRRFRVVTFGLLLSLAFLVLYIHGLYYYRAQVKHDDRVTASRLVVSMPESLPMVVDDEDQNPIRIGVQLEMLTGQPVYGSSMHGFDAFYFVSKPEGKEGPDDWTVIRVGPPAHDPRNTP